MIENGIQRHKKRLEVKERDKEVKERERQAV